MKKYIEPTIKIKEVELEDMIAASPGASRTFDNENDLDSNEIESKKFSNTSFWDDDEEVEK